MVNYSFSLITVRPDTLADMVSHMTKSVGLVHQMPFACDRTGLPATLEKVIIWLTSLINRFCLCFCQKPCALVCFHRAPFDKNVNKNKVVHTLASLDYVNFATRMSHEKKDKKRSRWRLKFFYTNKLISQGKFLFKMNMVFMMKMLSGWHIIVMIKTFCLPMGH